MHRAAAHLSTLLFVLNGRMTTVQERRDRGATAVEYGLLVGLIGVAIIGVVGFLGDDLITLFTNAGNALETASTTKTTVKP